MRDSVFTLDLAEPIRTELGRIAIRPQRFDPQVPLESECFGNCVPGFAGRDFPPGDLWHFFGPCRTFIHNCFEHLELLSYIHRALWYPARRIIDAEFVPRLSQVGPDSLAT